MVNNRNLVIKYLREIFFGQMYGKHSYIKHCLDVENVAIKYLSKYPRIEAIRLACLGHDIIEDTDQNAKDLEKYFSLDIIDLIERVTDGEGKNRRERHLNTYYKTREKEESVLVKLCDRIANLESSLETSSKKFNMYKKENDRFKYGLYNPEHKYAKILWEIYDKIIGEEWKK